LVPKRSLGTRGNQGEDRATWRGLRMSQQTSDDLKRPDEKDEQQTLLQYPAEANPLQTGIQAVSSAPRLEVGPIPLTRVADYELVKEIGRGGMGVVFKARHVRLNRIVALKMIRGGALANSDELSVSRRKLLPPPSYSIPTSSRSMKSAPPISSHF